MVDDRFLMAVEAIEQYALEQTQRSAQEQQLYYHNRYHVEAVRQRALRILEAIAPHSTALESQSYTHVEGLLRISATAHDMVQIFAESLPYTPRKRSPGESEKATWKALVDFIRQSPYSNVFSDGDVQVFVEAIDATVCEYDPDSQTIYQGLLYSDRPLSLVTQALALADLGALGMEGDRAFRQEGSLIVLEENPDMVGFVETTFSGLENELQERVRQRLLRRAQFEVNFARGRLARWTAETARLPASVSQRLAEVFPFLTEETIETIARITPVAPETPLDTLLDFFELREMAAIGQEQLANP